MALVIGKAPGVSEVICKLHTPISTTRRRMQGQRPRYAGWLFCTAALRALPGAQALFDAGLGKTAPMLAKNQALADQLRIQGTAALIVNDFIFRGAVDPSRLAAAIEATRAGQIKAAAAKS